MSNKINFTTNLIFSNSLFRYFLFVTYILIINQRVLARSLRIDEARDSNVVSCMRHIGNINFIFLMWIFNSNFKSIFLKNG